MTKREFVEMRVEEIEWFCWGAGICPGKFVNLRMSPEDYKEESLFQAIKITSEEYYTLLDEFYEDSKDRGSPTPLREELLKLAPEN